MNNSADMSLPSFPPPRDALPDPRTAPDFAAEYYPTSNGAAEFSPSADPRNDEVMRQFLAAYYAINVRYARLRELRTGPTGPDFGRRERLALQAIETALIVRDELEDRCAPFGVLAEPVARDGFTVDVKFTFGSTDAMGRFRSEPFTSSGFLKFRVPEGRRGKNLTPPGVTPLSGAIHEQHAPTDP